MLGGVIHSLKLPVSGLIVGSCAVLCICLIARYVPQKGSILKATIIVAIFKMLLSPQSPFPAYFAVFFQGLLGELLFISRRFYPLSCILLGILALIESGIQRILVMTLLYGKDFWMAVNVFINSFVGNKVQDMPDYAWYLAGGYVFLHALVGLLVGTSASMLHKGLHRWHKQYLLEGISFAGSNRVLDGTEILANSRKSKSYLKNIFWLLWVLLFLLYLQAYFQIGGQALLPQSLVGGMLFRSLFLLLSWYFLISPIFTFLLKKWLQKQQKQSKTELEEVLHVLPEMRLLLAFAWQQTATLKGLWRIWVFLKIVICYAVSEPSEP